MCAGAPKRSKARTTRRRFSSFVPTKMSRSWVNRGSAWTPTAHPPMTRYSALESANADNRSLKSGWRTMLAADHPGVREKLEHGAELGCGRRLGPELDAAVLQRSERAHDPARPGGPPGRGSLLEGVIHCSRIAERTAGRSGGA